MATSCFDPKELGALNAKKDLLVVQRKFFQNIVLGVANNGKPFTTPDPLYIMAMRGGASDRIKAVIAQIEKELADVMAQFGTEEEDMALVTGKPVAGARRGRDEEIDVDEKENKSE
jgi:hypothetical protein